MSNSFFPVQVRIGLEKRMKTYKWSLIVVVLLVWQCGCATISPAPKDPMPAFVDGARILFQGDSITDGNRGRNTDPNHILGHGYQALISSRYGADLPERHLTFMNRGISGNTVSALARRWQTDTIDLKPDILSQLMADEWVRTVQAYKVARNPACNL
jgi:hypothetical protein